MKVVKTAFNGRPHGKKVRINLRNQTRKACLKMLKQAQKSGDIRTVKRILTILAVADGNPYSKIAANLQVSEESIRLWVNALLLNGVAGLKSRKAPGRPPKLTKTQKRELAKLITKGPAKAGFPGACCRSPMMQALIFERFGVTYSVHYISQLLKNMGFSYQKAKFVADHKDAEKRQEWLEKKWPEILALAQHKNAYILFGDEASFPQWGSLTYTWAKRGQQPIVKTSGTRRGYKIFGLIDYFSGRFFCKGHENGRFNSESYEAFLTEVLSKTRKHIILIQDGAKYHTSNAMKRFFDKKAHRLTVYNLPSYSPDYNPIEKRWKKIKEKEIHLHYFPTFESLKNKVEEALLRFKDLKTKFCHYLVFIENWRKYSFYLPQNIYLKSYMNKASTSTSKCFKIRLLTGWVGPSLTGGDITGAMAAALGPAGGWPCYWATRRKPRKTSCTKPWPGSALWLPCVFVM